MSEKISIALLVGLAVLVIVIGLLLKPIPQPPTYHDFADQRSWLGVANTWNVLSNIPLALAGIGGLFLLLSGRVEFIDKRECWLWMGVSIGLVLSGLGSGYYHLAPNNSRIVWDRLGIVIILMSYVAALISERIDIRLGLWLWPILLIIGFFSVFLWYAGELHGESDLRFYLGVQVFTILVTLLILLTPAPYTRTWDLAVVMMFFGLARLFEIFDHQIYRLSEDTISGHSLKHLAAAMAGIWLIRMLWKRKIVKI